MRTPFRPTAMALSVAAAFPLQVFAGNAPAEVTDVLDPVVITAPVMDTPTATHINPRAPIQPAPANDGASLLKAIPGMSLIRKGGTDGDPVFRGMAASRLNILVDGEMILGGCGMRMDPPTAYVFPETFDEVTLIKGPQTVTKGAGGSAGTVMFERKPTYFAQPGTRFQASVTGGSNNRYDAYVDAKAGTTLGYVQVIASEAASDDYRDGNDKLVHAAYQRKSLTAAAGWTPDEHTRIELSAIESRAHAAYADRSMDGVVFDRSNVGLKFEKTHMPGLINRVEAQVYRNYVDHVMDNYSLRTPTGMGMASNPDRETTGGRVAVTLLPDQVHKIVLGVDQQTNVHTLRSSTGTNNAYLNAVRTEDARFHTLGLFGEITHILSDDHRVILGARHDDWTAKDQRASVKTGMSSTPNPTVGHERTEGLLSGFARYEHDLTSQTQASIGLGYTERAPDYWEIISKESASSVSVFDQINAEKTTQLDLGVTHRNGPLEAFGSVYYSQIHDYILIQSNVTKGMRAATIARNVDARTWGGEIGANYQPTSQWKALTSLAYVNGQNTTDGRALGQMAPLELRLGLEWDNGQWSAGALQRLVAAQHRYAINEGNIVGQDLGSSAGFGVTSIHGGYRWSKKVQLTAGIDNVFDKAYAEHISRNGATVMGYDTTTRVNEAGRTWWLKAQVAFN